jgi:hypothetical protein
MSLITGT